ncbi:MAG TPA: hypothetical protein EYN73_01770 [Chromatiaceae bacterium]|jgi:hypothetical protein|nr:hypothetical protein [Chromatiaceae bacterium]HIA07808.1 hypothetical protein [Chromatiaceae bacterium]HIN81565.1 hypothetical protein [Chromatiales bacterium]HIO13568.1 hypothetical protein [Chromatiales bacterium]HIO54752.1 hypothetical protein [Chromatiales bacterium]
MSSTSQQRLERLHELKREHETQQTDQDTDEETGFQGEELNAFIKELVEKKKQRKHQLDLIQEFFENPDDYGVQVDIIPSSSSHKEIDQRKAELEYRVNLLRSVLTALEGELELLGVAKNSPDLTQDKKS